MELKNAIRALPEDAIEKQKLDLIDGWHAREQELSDREPATDARIAWRLAELKWAAGFEDAARYDFYDAIDLANNLGLDDLVEEVRSRITELYKS